MHVCVVGAGVVGVTTAFYLSQQGHTVTVVDREIEVAAGASFGNGGQLSYSFTDALAKPEFIAKIPAILAGRDRGSKVRFAPAMLPWGFRFLAQCTAKRARENTLAVLRTAMRSAQLMQKMQDILPFDYSHRAAGKLVLLSDDRELQSARAATQLKNQHGCDAQVLHRDEALSLEPALAEFRSPFVGAVYSAGDEVADARLFTLGLKQWLTKNAAVTFKLGQPVTHLWESGGRVEAILLGSEQISADAIIVCGGAWSSKLLRPLGVDPQIYPVRGYSVTLPPGPSSPAISLTALKQRIVFSRINGDMRIAGFADFQGLNTDNDLNRTGALLDVAQNTGPLAANFSAAEQHRWGGFRPMTPDGQPRVGKTKLNGLFLNTGHGMLGWTLACASGYDVAAAVSQSTH